jgi:hypothetical protein
VFRPTAAGVEPLPEDVLHPLQLGGVGLLGVPAQDGEADGLVWRHGDDVHGHRALEPGEVRLDGAPLGPEPGVALGERRPAPQLLRVDGGSGAQPNPSGLVRCVVTPWYEDPSWSLLPRSAVSEWMWASMKPGVTTRPVASMRVAAAASPRSPIATIRSPFTPTIARYCGAPVPSTTCPPWIRRSRSTAIAACRGKERDDPLHAAVPGADHLVVPERRRVVVVGQEPQLVADADRRAARPGDPPRAVLRRQVVEVQLVVLEDE